MKTGKRFSELPYEANSNILKRLQGKIANLEKAMYEKPLLADLKVDKVKFRLWIKEGLDETQKFAYENRLNGYIYEPAMVECLKNLLEISQDPVFADIGAFMGYYCCFVSKYLNDTRAVYAVESNPEYCRMIEKSISENALSNAFVCNAILSEKEEMLNVSGQTVVKSGPSDKMAKTMTFDALCENGNIKPTILKIDVHGAEGKVLGGAQKILSEHVDFILLELHPDSYLRKYSPGFTGKSIFTILYKCGFEAYYVDGHRTMDISLMKYMADGKLRYIKITDENHDALFIDRYQDMFIFAIKRGCDMSKIQCFNS